MIEIVHSFEFRPNCMSSIVRISLNMIWASSEIKRKFWIQYTVTSIISLLLFIMISLKFDIYNSNFVCFWQLYQFIVIFFLTQGRSNASHNLLWCIILEVTVPKTHYFLFEKKRIILYSLREVSSKPQLNVQYTNWNIRQKKGQSGSEMITQKLDYSVRA